MFMKTKNTQRQLVFTTVMAVTALTLSPPGFAAIPPAGGPAPTAAVSQLLADAQKAIKAGNIPLAIIQLKNASSAAPRNGAVRAQLAMALLQSGDYYAAERELRQVRVALDRSDGCDQSIDVDTIATRDRRHPFLLAGQPGVA